nr:reverse transcriptase domain-containing protein [Tanacetum cinerariifolium]
MRTRSRSRSRNKSPQREASPTIVEPLRIELPFLEDQFQEDTPPESPMADNRTMAKLLQAPTEGYEDVIVIPEITANNFELKHGLINLVQNKQFFRHDKEDPHAHIRFDESFYEAWERFNDLLRACPLHGFSELHQFDTFYNALNVNDQDSLNSAAGGNFLDKMPRECLKIIKSKSKVRQSRAMAVVAKSPAPTPSTTPAPVKAVDPNCVTCGGAHAYQNYPATHENVYRDNIQEYVSQAAVVNYNQGNTGFRPQMVANQIRPLGFSPHQNNQNNFNKGNNFNRGGNFNQSNFNPYSFNQGQLNRPKVNQAPVYQAPIPQTQRVSQTNFESYVKANDAILRNMQIQGQSTQNQCQNIQNQYQNLQNQMATLTDMMTKLEKLSEMARTTMNEHCSAVILNKLPRKLGDPEKFLIPCEFSGMDEFLALADLGASINLMPLSVWEGLLIPELTPTCLTLKLADRLVSKPIGIAKDVSFKVGVFYFPADFVVVDFEPDPRVLLILGRNEAITYKLDQTVRYSANYNQMTTNKIDVVESTCEEYSQEVLGFSNVTTSGNPTPQNDPIISATSPTLTPFGDSNFLLFEEANAFLGLEDDPDSPKINPFYYDPEGDILLLEAILNSEPLPPLPNQEQNLPSFNKELKAYEAQTVKSSVDEPPEVELKDLPHHL